MIQITNLDFFDIQQSNSLETLQQAENAAYKMVTEVNQSAFSTTGTITILQPSNNTIAIVNLQIYIN